MQTGRSLCRVMPCRFRVYLYLYASKSNWQVFVYNSKWKHRTHKMREVETNSYFCCHWKINTFLTEMSCILFRHYIARIVTIVLCLPIKIACCSMSTDAINTLMTQNANFESDPCYIEWKAAEDAKLSEPLTRSDELKKSAYVMYNGPIQQESRKNIGYDEASTKRWVHSLLRCIYFLRNSVSAPTPVGTYIGDGIPQSIGISTDFEHQR